MKSSLGCKTTEMHIIKLSSDDLGHLKKSMVKQIKVDQNPSVFFLSSTEGID